MFFVCGRSFTGDAVAVAAEGFELVDEFVDDVPGPIILFPVIGVSRVHFEGTVGSKRRREENLEQKETYKRYFQIYRSVRVENVVE